MAAAVKLLASVDLILDMGMPDIQDEALRYGAGWRYTLKDEYSRVGTGQAGGERVGGKNKRTGEGGGGDRRRLRAEEAEEPEEVEETEEAEEGGRETPRGRSARRRLAGLKLWHQVTEELAEANRGDYQLYQTARALAALDAVVFNYAHRAGVATPPQDSCGHTGAQPEVPEVLPLVPAQ